MDHMNCIGRFEIDETLIKEQPDLVLKIMSEVIIVRAEHRFVTRTIEYDAISPQFEEVADGLPAPHYDLEVSAVDDEYELSWMRRKD